jgi:hypothetical protein
VSEKKVVRRSVAIGLGIICVVVVSSLVGAFAYYHYTPIMNDNDNTIFSLKTEISQLNLTISSLSANLTYLQDQLNGLLNVTEVPLGLIASNPSVWVNRTIIVEGALYELPIEMYLPWQIGPPWGYLLNSSNGLNQIGVQWNGAVPNSSQVQIYGVVSQGIENLGGSTIVFYIEALTINPFSSYYLMQHGATP